MLPAGAEDAVGGGLQASVVVGDHQLDAGEAAVLERAEEVEPEGFGLGAADLHAEHLAVAVGVGGDDHGDRDDPSAGADLDVSGVEPEVGPVALERAGEERLDPGVDVLAEA